MIKAVIFDLDGTLLNTLEDLWISTNFALSKFGYPNRSLEEVRTFVGNGVKKLIERAVPDNCLNVDECLEVFKEHYAENMYNHTKPYDGILDVLETLKDNEIKIGVVSNKFDAAVKELCEKYFSGLVDVSIGQSDDIPKKPAPDGVFKVLKEMNIELPFEVSRKNMNKLNPLSNSLPRREDYCSVLYVGDSDVDVMTAKNAGLPCIGVLWGFRDRDSLEGANFIINKPCDIIDVIRSL